ncbi:MAG TPA: DUF3987 domain-containing protein [Desulfovibrio sp.]|uniref:DUF3987 domain-containing protein n=1 Tax=Desulfovibrio sp. TaxID=885 RepID=UPI002D2F7BB3|nr:DUF3987 domain-containing protein [Desulfovibrio sp.]HZF61740.1 DUF3987 domain-containing protein [Desulfovibrio sp.]
MNFFAQKSTLLESALEYARCGFSVFPSHYNPSDHGPGQFSPLVANGRKAATTDESQIHKWWTDFPDAMISVPTGAASGLLAVTLPQNTLMDTKTPAFSACFNETCYIFQYPTTGEKPLCGAVVWGGGVGQFHGENGFIVVPPSTLRYNTPESEENSSSYAAIQDGELLGAPAELLEKIRMVATVEKAEKEIVVPLGMPAIFRGVEKKQEPEPEQEEEEEQENGVPELPLECLQPKLKKLVLGTAAALNVDPWLSFAAAIQCVSATIGANYMLDSMISAPAHLWLAIVGPSGSGKSALSRFFSAPIKNSQRLLDKIYMENMVGYKEAMLIYEDEYKAWMKNGRQEKKPTEPTKPACKTYFVDDITPETLQVVLAENPGGVCWSPDELTKLLGSFGRYSKTGKNNNDPAKSALLSMYDGGSVRAKRMSRESVNADNCWISIYGTIQPEILCTAFCREDMFSGFLHRFSFIVLTEQTPVHEDFRPRLSDFCSQVESLISPLLCAHEIVAERVATEEDKLVKNTAPRTICISREGEKLIRDYNQTIRMAAHNNKTIDASKELGDPMTRANRLCGQLPRIVLILHCLECAENGTAPFPKISTETVSRAITIFKTMTRHGRKAWEMISGKTEEKQKKDDIFNLLTTVDPFVDKSNDMYQIDYNAIQNGKKHSELLKEQIFSNGGTVQALTKALEKLGFSSWRTNKGKVMRIKSEEYNNNFKKVPVRTGEAAQIYKRNTDFINTEAEPKNEDVF